MFATAEPAAPQSTAAASDPSLEIASQRDLLLRLETTRIFATGISAALMAVFLPVWIALLAFVLDLGFEALAHHLTRNLDPARAKRRYAATLICIVAMEISFVLPSALIWQLPEPFAKAMAVGLITMTLFQLTTVRSIHLPFGIAGLLAVGGTAFAGNGYYWFSHDNPHGLAISSFAVLGAIYFSFNAMRTIHGLHREIIRAGAEAAAANRAKGSFLAQMSHELRTPLNAILGMGEAEKAANQSIETQDRMHTLIASARGLAAILDDILDMSAIGENVLPIRPSAAVPHDEIAATVALFRPVFSSAGLTLQLENTDTLPASALLDPQRLRQCLSNLLANALKFTETGGVVVTASITGAGLLQVDVTDTGTGISAQEVAVIFQPFQRGAGLQSGSGLGLAISRGLARRMGGDLVLVDGANGARFRLTVQIEPIGAPLAAKPAKPPDLSGRRVLIVDDIATNRLVAETYLRALGATVASVASGTEALAAIAHSPPDLVMLDMNMPGLSGLETLHHIRNLPNAPTHLPVVAMTADANPNARQNHAAAGLDGYLTKPLTPEAIASTLADLLTAPQGAIA